MTSPTGALSIGGFSASNQVLLAPMSGVTDLPFRRLAHRLGAGLVEGTSGVGVGVVPS